MKAALAVLWILSLVATFGLARLTGQESGGSNVEETVESLRAALEQRDELSRAHQLSSVLVALGPDDMPAALEDLKARQVGVSPEEVRLFMLAWSRFDAPGAFAWAYDWPTPWRRVLMSEAMYSWGFLDGAAAVRTLEDLEDSSLRDLLRPAALEGWLRSHDRVGAGAYVAAVSDPRQRGRYTFLLTAETARDGIDAVIRWAEAVPEDAPNDFKQGAFYHASGVVARADPQRAAEWFEAHRTRPYSDGSLAGIALKWAQSHDPPPLFDWLRGLPIEGERPGERSEAVKDGFRTWLKRAPEEAEAWLRSATPDPLLDPAVAELVKHLSGSSPAAALEWTARIQSQELRTSSAIQAGRIWWRQDHEAASAWIAESDLPEGARRAIQSGPRARARRPAQPEAQ
jgi:hypothetical protein